MTDENKISPVALVIMSLLAGGGSGIGTNMLVTSDAQDRYTGSQAEKDWEVQQITNERLQRRIECLSRKIDNLKSEIYHQQMRSKQ